MKNSSRFSGTRPAPTFRAIPTRILRHSTVFLLLPPLFLPECIGTPRWNANGIKDCTLCRVPHQPDNYDRIIQKLSAAIRERAAEGKKKGPRQPTE